MLMAVFALGLCSDVLAEVRQDYARISLCGPSGGKTSKNPSEFIILVIDGATVSYEAYPIPTGEVVEFVNNLLTAKEVSYIGVYAREGTKFGDVVRAMDALRKTRATNIGLSMTQIALGREP